MTKWNKVAALRPSISGRPAKNVQIANEILETMNVEPPSASTPSIAGLLELG